ncbi:MAG: histidine--tRNA ligase [Eubacteriales bacterium]|nr:histidine--tRNA ligase [Eubacteriales bacterium]
MQIKVLKGMKDILPGKSDVWQNIEERMRSLAAVYGYSEIRTPVLEKTELFTRGVGDTTDIVQKEMYTFKDKGDRSVTLKPEGTAGAVRAFLEANLYAETLPCKMYYINAPLFRYEAPQSGRLREHHQFGMECFGSPNASSDAELISFAYELLKSFGLKNLKVQLNSIGCPKCRPNYTAKLKEFLQDKKERLCNDCKNRMETNPLRVLDCKVETCQQAIVDAPRSIDCFCDECSEHFAALCAYLDAAQIPYAVNSKIVRGLDYYTKTVFEFVQETETGVLTVCGGGRYDNLIEQLGGPKTPAVGFGLGIERLIMLMEESQERRKAAPDVYIANITKEDLALSYQLLLSLRRNGIKSEMDHSGRSLKAQFKFANKVDAKYILLVGGEELQNGKLKIRNLETKEETEFPFENAIEHIESLVK